MSLVAILMDAKVYLHTHAHARTHPHAHTLTLSHTHTSIYHIIIMYKSIIAFILTLACECNSNGSSDLVCDKTFGNCSCYPNYTGRTCSECAVS